MAWVWGPWGPGGEGPRDADLSSPCHVISPFPPPLPPPSRVRPSLGLSLRPSSRLLPSSSARLLPSCALSCPSASPAPAVPPFCVIPPFCCPPPVFSPLHTHPRHTVQQQTNHAIAASASALKQMAELLRGCPRVCSLGAGGGRGPGPGVGRQMWTMRLLGAEVTRSSVHWAAGRAAVQVPWAPGLLGKSGPSPCPALRASPTCHLCVCPSCHCTHCRPPHRGHGHRIPGHGPFTAPMSPPPLPTGLSCTSSPGRLSLIHTLPAPPEVGGAQSMQCC